MDKYYSKRRGIILAGGTGTRLYPLTQVVSKQLMPVYDKPMIYYPLTTLMLAGITKILIITTPKEQGSFRDLLGNGAQWGLEIEYAMQAEPKGLAQAFTIGADFIGQNDCAMVLGDNLFYGFNFSKLLQRADQRKESTIFGFHVKNPEDYGVVELEEDGKAISVEEKPEQPKSPYAVTGLYFFDKRVAQIARDVSPSERGELEITSIIDFYLKEQSLYVEKLSRGTTWLDTGTHRNLLAAGQFIEMVETRAGLKIACPEEIAFRMGYISAEELNAIAQPLRKSGYGEYLLQVLDETLGPDWKENRLLAG